MEEKGFDKLYFLIDSMHSCLHTHISSSSSVFISVQKVESQPAVQGRIFSIVVRKARTGEVRKLQVNFQSDVIQLSKEVRSTVHMICAVSIHECT